MAEPTQCLIITARGDACLDIIHFICLKRPFRGDENAGKNALGKIEKFLEINDPAANPAPAPVRFRFLYLPRSFSH